MLLLVVYPWGWGDILLPFLIPTPLGTDQSCRRMDFGASLASSHQEPAQPLPESSQEPELKPSALTLGCLNYREQLAIAQSCFSGLLVSLSSHTVKLQLREIPKECSLMRQGAAHWSWEAAFKPSCCQALALWPWESCYPYVGSLPSQLSKKAGKREKQTLSIERYTLVLGILRLVERHRTCPECVLWSSSRFILNHLQGPGCSPSFIDKEGKAPEAVQLAQGQKVRRAHLAAMPRHSSIPFHSTGLALKAPKSFQLFHSCALKALTPY